MPADVDFYDPDKVMLGASVRDNLMFGRIGYGVADAARKVAGIVRRRCRGRASTANSTGSASTPIAAFAGAILPARLKLAVPLARRWSRRRRSRCSTSPALLATLGSPTAMIARLREHCAGMTLFLLLGDASLAGNLAADRVQRTVRA
jgi:putative ABC transport system ATP-binding protein